MFLVFSLQRLCKKSVLERKQIDNKAEKGYLKFCLDRQREIFEIFYWHCTWGASMPGKYWKQARLPHSIYCLKNALPGTLSDPRKDDSAFFLSFFNSCELLSRAATNIYMADPTDPDYVSIWCWLLFEGTNCQAPRGLPPTCLQTKWRRPPLSDFHY